jgi:conjugative transfer pilus assembly protein TraH
MFKKTLIGTLITVLLASSTAIADVQSEMSSWFNSMGGYSNITGAQVVNGQTSTTYTGGNMFVRVPTQNYQLVSAQAPSVEGGCGGIDLFAGSFSFINSAQLTALFRNIGNNAVNYAFILAIKSASPEISDILSYLQDQASKLNGLNVNSCHAAEGIVNAIAGPAITEKAAQAGAQGTGSTLSNLWTDSFQSWGAWNASNTAKKQAADAEAAADPNLAKQVNPGNIVYNALLASNVPSDLYPLMMGLTGAIIIEPAGQSGNTSGSTAQWVYVPPTGISFKDFIGDPSVATTTSLQGLACSDATCYSPAPVTMNVQSLSYDVQQTLNEGMSNIQSRTAQGFSTLDYQLFTNTSVPLWKLARTAAMNNNPALVSEYSQIIAIDLAYKWMMSAMHTVTSTIATMKNTAQTHDVAQASGQLIATIEKQEALATAEYQAAYGKAITLTNMQNNIKNINDEMMAALKPSIQSSVRKFSN